MAYHLLREDPDMQAAVRRIACEQVRKAVDRIDSRDAPDAVIHDVRKRCKKVRGLLRLVRPSFSAYKDENARFRDIAGPLGPLRDATVQLDTFEQLIRSDAPAAMTAVRDALRMHRDATARLEALDALLAAARSALQDALLRIDTWRIDARGFDAVADGLEDSYRRGRKAMRTAREQGDDDAFHTWRKRAKDHAMHLRILQPIWPGPMRAQRNCADALGALLGDHHDLAVLAERVPTRPDIGPEAVAALDTRIRARQHALARQAGALGARLYAEPPTGLVKAWRRRFKAWRRECATD